MANIAQGIGAGLNNFAGATARAASRANGVSAAAQSAQGTFNAGQAAIANGLGTDRLAEQYNFNAAQAAAANAFTEQMWDKSAGWNEMMWQRSADWNERMFNKQMDFNSSEAEKAREFMKEMESTKYQRAITDMRSAGLNPILAVTGGGISTGSGGASAASVGGPSIGAPSMSGASGQMASGGVLNGISASESSYTGQMEYMGGMLGLLSAAIGGISSAMSAMGGMGNFGREFASAIGDIFNKGIKGNPTEERQHTYDRGKEGTYENSYKKRWQDYWNRQ